MWRALLMLAVLAPAIAVAGPAPSAPTARPVDPAVERGRDLAARRCAECHAVRYGRDSPDGAAPPFPALSLRYNEISLERRLAGIPWADHAGMPPIGLTANDRQDLVAFIESLHARRF